MQGQQIYQPQLFCYMDMDSPIPQNHFLRKLDDLLNFDFIRTVTAPYYKEGKGRPSIDPETFFRMIILGYLYGIKSDRRVCEEVTYNLAYRWFCKLSLEDKVPDHSSFTRIRDRLGEGTFKQFFLYILQLCEKHGLLKGESIMVDSTLVEANASLDSMAAIDEEQAAFEEKQLLTKSPTDPMPSRKLSNKTHLSQSDPDSSLAHKKGTSQTLKYKVHNCIDATKRIIVDTYVTTGKVHDSQSCLDRIYVLMSDVNFKVQEVIADRGYGSAEITSTLTQQNITTYIPLFSTKSGANIGNGSQGFVYDAPSNIFTCPQGKHLKSSGKVYNNLQQYFSVSSDCKECSSNNSCTATRKGKGFARYVRRNVHQTLYNQVLQEMETDVFKKKLLERKWKIEGLFAEAKDNHGLRRAKYRGLSKMQIQAYMTASVQNLKRIVQRGSSLLNRLDHYTKICIEINVRAFLTEISNWHDVRQRI